ncbi:MAG: response regulator transcription factor [Lachnospiraceae bacterium]|nr:response regulator transcription factor [Lachnospiraceae bacterium]
MTKILIIEDDTDINNLLAKIMRRQGYEAVQAFSGTEGKLRLELEQYDLLLLDLMLPGMMGEELIGEIRQTDPDLSIIVLSAKSGLEERVEVLELGADDYMVKPFAAAEVEARVAGALRRSTRRRKLEEAQQESAQQESAEGLQFKILQYKELTLDADRREVRVRGQILNLTAHEYDILYILLKEPGKVYSRERLYELVWQGGYYGEDNTVNVHVSNLRKKIAVADTDEYIATVWGIGFRMA